MLLTNRNVAVLASHDRQRNFAAPSRRACRESCPKLAHITITISFHTIPYHILLCLLGHTIAFICLFKFPLLYFATITENIAELFIPTESAFRILKTENCLHEHISKHTMKTTRTLKRTSTAGSLTNQPTYHGYHPVLHARKKAD